MSYVLPIKNDKIETKDGEIFKVESYTNLQDSPAVYVESADDAKLIYFSDINNINKVKVELDKSNIFKSLGPIRRVQHIAAINDIITVDDDILSIDSLSLHSKKTSMTTGLVIIAQDKQYSLNDIDDIEYADGGKFNKRKFREMYADYFPLGGS